MTQQEATKLYAKGKLVSAEVLPAPSADGNWFVLLHNNRGKSFMLVDSDERIITRPDLNGLIETIREIGFRIASIRM